MAIKYWLGGINSDKSSKMLEYVVKSAADNPQKQYLIIVPEQNVFSVQRELVSLSATRGILNIDVLSFMRFAHRISDEVGSFENSATILDEMGKTLILQHLASKYAEELSVFKSGVDKLGIISQIKSIISELMQYGVSPEKVQEIIDGARNNNKSLLVEKLQDVNFLYTKFLEYIKDKYTTTEETLDKICTIVKDSKTIAVSEIIFDGFTGFTPVQLNLIGRIMDYSGTLHVALLMEEENDANPDKETELFHLSKKTMMQLNKMADERGILIEDAYKAWEGKKQGETSEKYKVKKRIFAGQNPEDEVLMMVARIRDFVTNHGYKYKDIAVVTGDLDAYRYTCEKAFDKTGIPYFVDKTKPMLLNPFVEYIRAIMAVFTDNYSYEAMFRFLKSGILAYEPEQINKLDNYCLAAGIKGRKGWHEPFIKKTMDTEDDDILRLEEMRKSIVGRLDKFSEFVFEYDQKDKESDTKLINAGTKARVRTFATALYLMIVSDDIEAKLRQMSEEFREKSEFSLAEEYGQVYRYVMDILDELVKLIPDEIVDVRTFSSLLNAGLDNIKVGIIPKSMDYIQIGDLTRSRIGDVKALFILGANDGIIPKVSGSGGIINDSEREFIAGTEANVTLAPTAKEDAYTQRLYVYMAVNKPSENLFISYAKVDKAGKSQMPSYIVKQICKEDKSIKIEKNEGSYEERLLGNKIAFSEFISMLNRITNNGADDTEEFEKLKDIMEYFLHDEEYRDKTKNVVVYALVRKLADQNSAIGKAVASVLYGKNITGSVTSLETYANCSYQYFLRYGLKLKERELFSFEASDMGTIFHNSLSEFSETVEREQNDWFTLTDEEIEKMMEKAVDTTVAREHMASLYSSARTSYMVNRIKRIMNKTGKVIVSQLKLGQFLPKYFEVKFEELNDIRDLNIRLSDDEYMRLYGQVDRIDTCEKDDAVYVKIIDYKSSGKKMDLAAVYEGRQLQLLVYLNAAMERVKTDSSKEVKPAGILYYHIDDPIIDVAGGDSDEKIQSELIKKFKMSGLINGDDNGDIIELMDMGLNYDPTVVNAKRLKTTGGLGKSEDIISADDFDTLLKFADKKVKEIGREILDGNIQVPKADGVKRFTGPKCEYCDYKSVCAGENMAEDEDLKAPKKDEMLPIIRKTIGEG